MPWFDQSVARHVGREGSKSRTPSFIASMMVSFDFSKALFNSAVHSNLLAGLRSSLKTFISLAIEKAYDPWLTRPNQALAPVMSFGVGKFLIESRNFCCGFILSGVTVSPPKSASSTAN